MDNSNEYYKKKQLGTKRASIIDHERLERNYKFKELKSGLDQIYEDLQKPLKKQTFNPNKSFRWKRMVYSSLLSLIKEITYTEDRSAQEQLIHKVYAWFQAKVVPREALPSLNASFQKGLSSQATNISFTPHLTDSFAQNTEKTSPRYTPSPVIPSPLRKRSAFAPNNFSNQPIHRQTVSEWGQRKSRDQEELNKKYEYPLKFRQKPESSGLSSTNASNVYDLRNSGYDNFQTPDLNQTMPSLLKGRSNSPFRKTLEFTTPLSSTRNKRISEVQQIKDRLASQEINCPISVIESGLVSYEAPFSLSLMPTDLPRGGELLLKNPFFKNKSKKSKKSKKKGKKKSKK